jgi:hypothetical protein
MQQVYDQRTFSLCDIWRNSLELEEKVFESSMNQLKECLESVDQVDTQKDAQLFIEQYSQPVEDEGIPLEDPSEDFIINEDTRIYLLNTCIKTKKKLEHLENEIEMKEQDVNILRGQLNELQSNQSSIDQLALIDQVQEVS